MNEQMCARMSSTDILYGVMFMLVAMICVYTWQVKKRIYLFAWKDALTSDGHSSGETFWQEVEETSLVESHSFQGQWVTAGRLRTLVGEAEAEDMMNKGDLEEKLSASGRRLFFYIEEPCA